MKLPHILKAAAIGLLLMGPAVASAADPDVPATLDAAKMAFEARDYARMWQELDKVTGWLEATAPRQGVTWEQAEGMIRAWLIKNWHKEAITVTPVGEGGMATTVERHQGQFYGYFWDTGEKTVTKDFAIEVLVTALDSKGKEREHRINFHFEKGPGGWFISRAGVM